MARTRGSYNFSQNFEVFRTAPLDARQKVQYYTDLVNQSTWEDSNGYVWLYKGAIVVVTEDPSSGLYWLTDAANYGNYDNWRKIVSSISGEGADGINIGDGSAGVYAGNDASGNLQFRTFKGSGGTVVTQSGNEIIIAVDASYSGQANYGENVGDGDASLYVQNVGDALQFRELKAGQSISLDVSGNLIIIDVSGGGTPTYDTSLDPSLAMPATVGGIQIGTTVDELRGDTLIKMWDDLLFPTVNPTYIVPYNSFSDDQGPYEEIGDSIDIVFTAGFNRGQILVSGNFQNYRSGLPNTYTYTGTGIAGAVSSTSLSDSSTLTGYTVLIGPQTWTNTVSFDEGTQPFDNKGNPYDSSLAAGTTSSKSVSFEGIYPIYATISDIADPDEKLTPLNYSMLSGNNINISFPAESGGNKQSFDVAQAWEGAPTNRPLLGVEQYDSNFDVWNALSFLSFTKTSTTHGPVSYWRYTYNGAPIGARLIRLKFN